MYVSLIFDSLSFQNPWYCEIAFLKSFRTLQYQSIEFLFHSFSVGSYHIVELGTFFPVVIWLNASKWEFSLSDEFSSDDGIMFSLLVETDVKNFTSIIKEASAHLRHLFVVNFRDYNFSWTVIFSSINSRFKRVHFLSNLNSEVRICGNSEFIINFTISKVNNNYRVVTSFKFFLKDNSISRLLRDCFLSHCFT